ncbi:MAG: glycosyltransferase family A protein [Caulobacteraceae bacterium]
MTAVSVIVPLYNDESYLDDALHSILGQTRPPEQVIVIDDGSTDASVDVARKHLPRITLLSQANQGAAAARNLGIAAATGDVIAFLDADDLWTASSLQRRLDILDGDPEVDAVYGLVEQFISPEVDAATRERLHLPEGQTAARFAGAILVRRRVFDRIGVFDPALKVGEMIDWTARLQDSGAKVVAVEDLVMRRRIHGANTMLNKPPGHGDYLRALRASVARKAAAKHSTAG